MKKLGYTLLGTLFTVFVMAGFAMGVPVPTGPVITINEQTQTISTSGFLTDLSHASFNNLEHATFSGGSFSDPNATLMDGDGGYHILIKDVDHITLSDVLDIRFDHINSGHPPSWTGNWSITGEFWSGPNLPDNRTADYTIYEDAAGNASLIFTSPTGSPLSALRIDLISPESDASVPEPASMLLLGSALIGLAGYMSRRFRKK